MLDRQSCDVRIVNEVGHCLSDLDHPAQVGLVRGAFAQQDERRGRQQRLEIFQREWALRARTMRCRRVIRSLAARRY